MRRSKMGRSKMGRSKDECPFAATCAGLARLCACEQEGDGVPAEGWSRTLPWRR